MTTERPYEPAIKDALEQLQHGNDCLDLLLRGCAPELARMDTGLEERCPTDSELPEPGVKRTLRGLEVLTRAIEHFDFCASELEHIEAARAWDADQEPRTPKPLPVPLPALNIAGALVNLANAHAAMEEVLTYIHEGDAEIVAEAATALANIRLAESQLKRAGNCDNLQVAAE